MRLPGVDHFARIHLVVRIPQPLELAERVDQLLSEHFRQQRAARLAVAVFARKRSAMRDDDVGGAIDKLAIFQNAGFALEIEIHPHVHAAVAVVAVERAVVAVLAHQREERAQIRAEAIRRHG